MRIIATVPRAIVRLVNGKYDRPTIKMQQHVWIRLRAVRHVVDDKMLEIPDSLNERGMTNKRHSIRRTWIRTGTSNACRDWLGLFGDRKYRAKIWTIPDPWIVGDGDGIAASSVIDSGSKPRHDGDSARETAPGRSQIEPT